MAVTKMMVDKELREQVFELLDLGGENGREDFLQVSNQSFGIALSDLNNASRMVEVKITVRKEDEELDGSELLEWEVEEYQRVLEERAEREKEKAAKKAKAAEKVTHRHRPKKEEADED